jgi:positive regulator of sigma E activity
MKKTILKVMFLTLFGIILGKINQLVFRSEIPSLTIITLIGSVVVLIYFPYNKFFNNKKQN